MDSGYEVDADWATKTESSTRTCVDLIRRKFIEQADQWATSDNFDRFDRFYGKIVFHPIETADVLIDRRGRFIGYDYYCVDVADQMMTSVIVRLDDRNNIQMWYPSARDWTSVKRLMMYLAGRRACIEPLGQDKKQSESVHRQWLWWRKNGKTFRLLDLPLEVREIIYGFGVAKVVLPYPKMKSYRFRPLYAHALACGQVNMSLRKVNRQLYRETGSAIFRHTMFEITHMSILAEVNKDSFFISRLSKLRITLDLHTFLDLFGLFISWDHFPQGHSATKILREMNLKELVLDMPYYVHAQPLEGGVICHKTFVDYVLEAAFKWVRGHSVRVTGCLRRKQKKSFEQKCAEERKLYLRWREDELDTLAAWDRWEADDYGVRVDGQVALQVKEEEQVERAYPPTCECRKACNEWKWSILE